MGCESHPSSEIKKNRHAHILFSKIESDFYQEVDPYEPPTYPCSRNRSKTLLTHEAGAIQ